MDTKGIELTECNNCRFRAVVDGKEVTGRIGKSKKIHRYKEIFNPEQLSLFD